MGPSVGKRAICNDMEMQKGNVPATWANVELWQGLTAVARFVEWFKEYYGK